MCCIPEGQVCDFKRPTHANNYACCWPLKCDPYLRTGITVCQERLSRFPDSSAGGSASRSLNNTTVIRFKKLPYAWYSDENPAFRSE